MMPTPHPAVNPTGPSEAAATPGSGAVTGQPLSGVVDTHFHAFARTTAGAPGSRYVPDYAAPIEAWDTAVAPNGITHGVLVQPSFLGTDNSHLLQLLAERPAQLRGVAVVSPDFAVHELRRMDALGVCGVRLNLVGTDHRIGEDLHPLFDQLEALSWHLQIHTDHGRLAEVLRQLPGSLTVVVDHFGKPASPTEFSGLVAGQHDRLYVKLSAPYRLAAGCEAQDLAARWLDRVGPMRLVWGSDWPCTAHEQAQATSASPRWLADWLASDTMREVVLTDNALSLYGF
ncbi:amidohydrolase family protein [Roseateles sp. UC29_93]|uniref:amidohydrolase family protein n=1 Tax=Roseateles sp. UC29_93 TaxID=3350177 RepID=UPI003671BC8F